MPVTVGGRLLGVERNGVFSTQNTRLIPGGRLWPEAAVTWNAMRLDFIAGGGHPADFMPAGPNSSARTLPAQEFFYAHQPPPAAVPGTSNHGWGIAVDVKTHAAAAWILANGHRYGWSWDEGQRAGEWWHYRYVGASRSQLKHARLRVHPEFALTRRERRTLKAYRALGRKRREHGGSLSPADVLRRHELREKMVRERRRIWRAAHDPRRGGWDHAHRRERYAILRRVTK